MEKSKYHFIDVKSDAVSRWCRVSLRMSTTRSGGEPLEENALVVPETDCEIRISVLVFYGGRVSGNTESRDVRWGRKEPSKGEFSSTLALQATEAQSCRGPLGGSMEHAPQSAPI